MDGRYWWLSVRGRTDDRLIHRLSLYVYANVTKPDLESSNMYESSTYGAAKHTRSALVSREWTLFREIMFVVRVIQTQAQRVWRKYRDSDVILDTMSLPLIALHLTHPKSASEHHKVYNTLSVL